MLTLVQVGNTLPVSFPVDSSAEFQPGQIAQLKIVNNNIVCGLSDGTAPFGILDDVRARAFTQSVVDEIVLIQVREEDRTYDGYGGWFSMRDTTQHINNANIVRTSFVADYEGLVLNSTNGIITLPAGSRLNFDSGSGTFDSVKTIINYVYQVPDIPGDDSTLGSNRCTIWFQRGIFATDQFDTTQRYPLNATLFVNENGVLTTKQPTPEHPGVAMCIGPPSAMIASLEFLWL